MRWRLRLLKRARAVLDVSRIASVLTTLAFMALSAAAASAATVSILAGNNLYHPTGSSCVISTTPVRLLDYA